MYEGVQSNKFYCTTLYREAFVGLAIRQLPRMHYVVMNYGDYVKYIISIYSNVF